jgi:hypothetical protein
MTHNVTDITELIRYHLVLAEVDDDKADHNLAQLMRNIEQMMTSRLNDFVEWLICDGCGASVSTELIDPHGAGWTADGSFNCSDCRFAEEGGGP